MEKTGNLNNFFFCCYLLIFFRYDPSSKCFSYVPAKSLKEHYKTAPKKKTSIILKKLDSSSNKDFKKFEVTVSDLTPKPETSNKWENEIDKVCFF